MNIITFDVLSRAIANRVGIDIEEARRNAGFVLDIFGYDDRVIDNVLNNEDRQLFYILEEEGMLTTDQEDTILYDGREWRTHYWVLKKNTILKYAKDEKSNVRSIYLTNRFGIYLIEVYTILLQRKIGLPEKGVVFEYNFYK